MPDLTYAIITPSFRLDFERCKLLVETVNRFIPKHVTHYLVIDRRDVPLFKPLTGERTKIVVVEAIIPKWICRIPGVKRFWWSWRSIPLKNWILQQIVKLSMAKATSQDVLLYVDSDVFFVRPFDPRSLEKDGKVPMFMEDGQIAKGAADESGFFWFQRNDQWHQVAAKILGLEVEQKYDTNFIGNMIPWRRENVLSMHHCISELHKRDWERAVTSKLAFSEYVLYGLYVSRLKWEESGHYQDDVDRTLCHWSTDNLNENELIDLKSRLTDEHHSVMINAKSPTSVDLVRKVFVSDN